MLGMETNVAGGPALGELSLDVSELVQRLNEAIGPSLVAAMSGAKDAKAPFRWAKPGATMRPEPERNLRFAYRVLSTLAPLKDERMVRTWFVSSNPELGEDSPIDAISAGRHREVIEAATRFVSSLKPLDVPEILRQTATNTTMISGAKVNAGAKANTKAAAVPDLPAAASTAAKSKVTAHEDATDSSIISAYVELNQDLKADLETDETAGEASRGLATMRQVAEQANVSIKTVSNVVNGSAKVSQNTKKRVELAIRELGYQVNQTARNLRQGRTRMIGLVVPELRVPYFAELAYSVLKATEAHGLALLIEQSGPEGENEVELLRSPRRRYTDGVLFSPVALDPRRHPELEVDYPLVLLGERVFDPRYHHVTMANIEASKQATLYLAGLGCKHIAVLGYHQDEVMGSARLRFDGYLQGLEAAGLDFDPRLLGPAGRWVRSTGYAAMHQILDSGAPIDGVFAMNDALALGALHALRERGVKVPKEVAVVGFDDIDDAKYSDPPLTSIDPGRDEIAHKAVDLLVSMIEGDQREPQQIVAGFSLVERESTARKRKP